MSNDTFNDLLAGNAPAFTFENIGDTCRGKVISAEKRRQTDIDGTPKSFPSGDPMMQLVVTVEQDNGEQVSLYIKGGKFEPAEGKGQSALEALRAATQGQDFKAGGTLAMQFSGLGKAERGKSAPKLYTVQYKAPSIAIPDGEDLF